MQKKRTIIISNRLPIRIEKRTNKLHFIPSEGGLATGLGSYYKTGSNVWVGWPGYIPENESEEQLIRTELAKLNLIPVFLSSEDLEGYYEGFSNEILWPICHYRLSYAVFDKSYWLAYQKVNQQFCEIILNQNITSKDELWVHDYQLMLLPQLLRQQRNDLTIGYFQHIPFPADEIFRCIPWRNELLKGLLGADLIAFHTYHDAQHFLNSCLNILGLSSKNSSVRCRDHRIQVEVFPMGIDFDKFEQLSRSDIVLTKVQMLKEQYQKHRLILSIDRLDYSKGISERLSAYEGLLQHYPELRNKVVLYMLVVPSRDNVPQYKLLRDEIDRMVGHINAVYGSDEWTPITYFYNSLPIEDISALYVAADICLVTSLRDGMNLVCKEYIASKAQDHNGVLILSEFAGAAKELPETIQINPNAIEDIMQAMHLAIYMPRMERQQRMRSNVAIVKKFNISHWVKLFFVRLHEVKSEQKALASRKMQGATLKKLTDKFQQASRRLFFLDYDGTLVGFKNEASAAKPTAQVMELLANLQSDEANQITIISGRQHSDLNKWFGDKGYYLIGEHGAWSNVPDGLWRDKPSMPTNWKPPVRRIMAKFTDRTPGSTIEEKNYSLAWHYRKVHTGLGMMRAQELADALRYLLPQYDLQLLMGDKVIEIKINSLNKGKSALEVVAHHKPDFIFAIGDDSTDEDMFYELPDWAVTIKVGNKQTLARYYIENQEDVIKLLQQLTPQTTKSLEQSINTSNDNTKTYLQ
ncbi:MULTISPECIES: bifunctional alpha,alpha-trehalose-phosphate synthase (UDP-forming)/trehalose-phosphatase [Sphingobacterium]|uniref:bifunctional alpha,alpha-trehalose-phosphate synthase (UDP-forming)/trehalose-phosphatase n=1 Tax=Sphingobacterium TaxID=28453 RepID=UPI0013DD4BB3|nr:MULTISPECIES: bifunctional alpha,alpha-trehalose-phosphate synthase (UDP-forming)/trehalose-phosphatase [unclassified Sphingobacterium]